MQGYIDRRHDIGFPQFQPSTAADGDYFPRIITGTDPAAGGSIAESVPTNAVWEVVAIAATLTTDATAATRRPVLVLDDGGVAVLAAITAADTQLASVSNKRFTWASGCPMDTPGGGVSNVHQAIPQRVLLRQAHRVRITAENLQAGDNFSAPVLMVRERLEPIT
jgi:hypothetical protein